MALFSDASMIGLDDLAGYEGNLLETAASEGIDLTRKLALAREEVGLELAAALARTSSGGDRDLRLVVFTPALRAWYVFQTIAIAYREAYHNQLNDRFKGKWEEYRDLAKWASQLLQEIGIGMTADPVPEAAKPSVTVVGGAMEPGSYYVSVSWLNAAGEEGLPSAPERADVADGEGFEVRARSVPSNIVGWHVYVGSSPDEVVRQTTSPLDRDATWMSPGPVSTEGQMPGKGQEASFYRQTPRVLLRG